MHRIEWHGVYKVTNSVFLLAIIAMLTSTIACNYLAHMCRSKVIGLSVCLSVVVIMKIARSRHVGNRATRKHD